MVAVTHPAAPAVRLRPALVGRPPSAVVYRRRRLAVLGAVVVAAALLIAVVSAVRADGAAPVPEPVATVSVVVEPGDTVWSLATALAAGEDPRPVVDAIVAANGGAALVAGQRLTLAVP